MCLQPRLSAWLTQTGIVVCRDFSLFFILSLFICPSSTTVSHRLKQILGYSPKHSRRYLHTVAPSEIMMHSALSALFCLFIYTKTPFFKVLRSWKVNDQKQTLHIIRFYSFIFSKSITLCTKCHCTRTTSAQKHLQKQIVFYGRL